MKPKISVVMPVHNNEQFIKEAITSILKQSYSNFELIIVDDGSTDKSNKIIASFSDKRIKIIRNKQNLGLTRSINIALKEATGNFLARMDGDDVSYPERFELQLKAFRERKDLFLVGAQADLIKENGEKIKTTNMPTDYESLRKVVIRYNPFIHPTLMFRRLLLEEIGFYNENFRYAQDYDFILRALKNHRCQNLDQPLLALRLTTRSTSLARHRQQQLTALLIRLRAVFKYHYPWYNLFFLIKPLVSVFIPISLKKAFYPI